MNPAAYREMADTEARHWWFTGRRAILATIIKALRLPPAARILEIGAGTGGNLAMLSSFGQVFALEPDAAARALCRGKGPAKIDVRAGHWPTEIPFAGETFDLICFFDVLEHIEEDVAALAICKRYLSPNGRVVLTVPACRWLWSSHDLFLHHRRRYGANELREKIASAGLVCQRLSHFNTLLFPLAVFTRLMARLSGNHAPAGTKIPPRPVNALLRAIFSAERYLLPGLSLPLGLSLLAVLGTRE